MAANPGISPTEHSRNDKGKTVYNRTICNRTAYIGGILLDGTEKMRPQPGQVVLVENGRIAGIQSEAGLLPENCEVVNLHGAYLMPGLINLHVHLNSGGKPSGRKKKPGDYVRLVKIATSTELTRKMVRYLVTGLAQTELRSGVTTIRTVGGIANSDSLVRDAVERRILSLRHAESDTGMRNLWHGDRVQTGWPLSLFGRPENCVAGPRILAGNTGISVPGGHMAGSLAYPASSPDEAVRLVNRIASDRPDLIKLMITGGVMDAEKRGEPGVLKMSPDIILAACDEAHLLGLPVAAHVESTEGVIAALRGGVDTIEHGAMPTQEMIRLFHEKGSTLTTTISPVLPLALLPVEETHVREMDRFNAGIVLRGIIECSRMALRERIPVGLGTDTGCPYVTQYDTWRELQYFHRFCGVSRRKALHTATLGNARIAKIDDRTGSIEAGKDADFLITKKNPLEDLRALREPAMVVARGFRLDHPEVSRYGFIEERLDRLLEYGYEDLDRLLT